VATVQCFYLEKLQFGDFVAMHGKVVYRQRIGSFSVRKDVVTTVTDSSTDTSVTPTGRFADFGVH
jgi:hypothetical protein